MREDVMKILSLWMGLVFVCIPLTILAEQCDGIADDPIRDVVEAKANDEFHLVVDWRIAQRVGKDRCPTGEFVQPISVGRKVYVWMRTAGTKPALDRLVREKRLPLKHSWHYQVGARWIVQQTIVVSGSGVSDNVIGGLYKELKNRKFFDWRTWSNKVNLQPGRWRITILDRLGAPVLCIDDIGPCEIEFEIE